MRILSLKAICLAMLASTAQATTFEFIPTSPKLVPVLWNYREQATRTVIGCRQWDVLQGTGWFQATWYSDYVPEAQTGVYSVTPQQNLAAKICAAKMDQYNSVRLEAGERRGSFSINPDGLLPETRISCHPVEDGDAFTSLSCDEAHVAVPKQGTVRIYIDLQE